MQAHPTRHLPLASLPPGLPVARLQAARLPAYHRHGGKGAPLPGGAAEYTLYKYGTTLSPVPHIFLPFPPRTLMSRCLHASLVSF